MDAARLLRRRGRAAGGPAYLLRAGDVPLSERPAPHGPCPQLHAGRRGGALQACARLRGAASDGVGRLRAAGGERGARARRASGSLDLQQHRDHARDPATARLLAELGPRVRHLRAALLRPPAEAVPRHDGRWARRASRELGELGPGRPDRARQRAGGGRARLALRCRGREEAAQPVVPAHHQGGAGAAGGAGRTRALAGAGAHHAGALDRSFRGRAGAVPADGSRGGHRPAGGLHHTPGHAVRHVVPGDRPRASVGRRGGGAQRGGGGVRGRVPQPGHQRGGDRDRREARLRHRPACRASLHAGDQLPGLDRQLRADGIRHRRDLRLPVRRCPRLRVRPQVRPADPAGGGAAGWRAARRPRL